MLLEVNDLSVSYGDKLTVTGTNIELDKGEILSIVGESGSGKTTVIRAIMGCLPGKGKVTNGSIIVDGKDVLQNTKEEWRQMCGNEMSMIFQDSGNMINPIRQIGDQFIDYILTHDRYKTKSEAYKMATDMLIKMHLANPDNIMKSYPFELSGGMRQRVGIAMAMVFRPKILLADEPTSALDVTTQAQIIRQIVDVRNEFGVAVIMVTHNLGVASYVSNKLIVMKDGKVIESGLRENVISNPQTDYTKELLAAVPVIGEEPYYDKLGNKYDNNVCSVMEIKNLTKQFDVSDNKVLTACDNVSLNVFKGQTLGIIGESGCGKSTLVRTVLQLYPTTEGEVIFEGKNIINSRGETERQNRRHIQMVFQDPSAAFNPKMKVKDILTEPLKNYGLIKDGEVDTKAEELLRMVELPVEFKDRYPHSMSGGQRQRIGIARALSLEPQIIICDEATSALDVSVQEKVCELLCKLQKERNITFVFIAHDLGLVDLMCHQVAVMYLGNVVELLEKGRIGSECKHPYSKALMKAVFKVDFKPGEKIEGLEGEIPSPLDLPIGCPFQGRCEKCFEKCTREKPLLKEVEKGHFVACHLYQ